MIRSLNSIVHAAFKIYEKKSRLEFGRRLYANELVPYFENKGLDGVTDGFWVYDIDKHEEFYSRGFRESLGFEGEHDFPNSPQSWQLQLRYEEDLKSAINLLQQHIESRGEIPYALPVTYWKKDRKESIDLYCFGVVIEWSEKWEPMRMLGAHRLISKK